MPIYASTAVAGLWLTALATSPRRLQIVKLGLAAALATGLIAALQVVPAQEYAPLAKRWVGQDNPIAWDEPIPYAIHQHFTWKPAEILGIVTPRQQPLAWTLPSVFRTRSPASQWNDETPKQRGA